MHQLKHISKDLSLEEGRDLYETPSNLINFVLSPATGEELMNVLAMRVSPAQDEAEQLMEALEDPEVMLDADGAQELERTLKGKAEQQADLVSYVQGAVEKAWQEGHDLLQMPRPARGGSLCRAMSRMRAPPVPSTSTACCRAVRPGWFLTYSRRGGLAHGVTRPSPEVGNCMGRRGLDYWSSRPSGSGIPMPQALSVNTQMSQMLVDMARSADCLWPCLM